MLTNEEVKHAKPDPEIYLKARSCMGKYIRPILAVEDTEIGVRSAQTAGIPTFHVKSVMEVSYENVTREIARAREMVA